ncbi:carbamoyltransferase HypF [Pandoraea communis]|uniref:carbamoyltransferase HypF n=1 Tax=Pandoraea communis TaxID=2508297 RepID=UPI0025A6656B|nr:carbamoyltransferase HypF [Pandoraea communis]MDM8355498.1 carbamoyltransferase HypF [Pandoraea communis]
MGTTFTDTIVAGSRLRLRMDVTGAVQGVGFRPFVHRLAVSEGLGGFVRNTGEGVSLEVEGTLPALERFLARLDAEIAPPAAIHRRQSCRLPAQGEHGFLIAPSATGGRRSAMVLPDLAVCPACLGEILAPNDRRYRYPFTTCMHCGPRYSLIEAVPYDRLRTAMRHFPMCAACRKEYDEPGSRRFHAECNACPECGPQLALWDTAGTVLAERHQALRLAADAVRQGRIVALKGLGGFQLIVDARCDTAVRRLRECKARPAKPFAIMVQNLADASMVAELSEVEQRLLCSAAAPIVLVRARTDVSEVARSVAPANPLLGVMLPSTPLHVLLMLELGFPVVATSGNLGGEPIVTDEREALERLAHIADLFLVHDRPILRPVDDSVVRVIAGREAVLRRARGYAPLSLAFPFPSDTEPVLALGAHQKSTIALAVNGRVVLGPHIGDLAAPATREAFAQAVESVTALYGVRPLHVACDLHPDYYSTRFADASGLPVRRVPHHLAHVLAGTVDNDLEGPVLGVAWDGAGYGMDGSIWGGEFLAVDANRFSRVAHLLPFRLAGGEAAMREPRRAALGALYAIFGDDALAMSDQKPIAAFTAGERHTLGALLSRGVNAPLTSSAGRLFDAVAALLDLVQIATFEGEAAMAVEFAAQRAVTSVPLAPPRLVEHAGNLVLDWRPMLADIVAGCRDGIAAPSLAAAFHDSLVEAIVAVATRVGFKRVLLSGGCFQNARLVERAVGRLRQAGFDPYWHHRIPPNDGGIAVGQAAFAARPLAGENI